MRTLRIREVDEVTGRQVGVGLAMISLAVSLAATGGLGGIAVGAILGAGYGTDLARAATALGLADGGGVVVGTGLAR